MEFMQQSHGHSQQGLNESGVNGGHGPLFVQLQGNSQKNPHMHPFVYQNGMNDQYIGQQPAQCGQYANQSIIGPGSSTMAGVQEHNGLNGLCEMVQQIQQTNMSFLSRLASIENSVSRLGSIEQNITIVRKEHSELARKMSKFDETFQSKCTLFDQQIQVQHRHDVAIKSLENENLFLHTELKKANEKCEKQNEEIQEIKARSMQENLQFFGLCENGNGENEDTESKLREFMKNELTLGSPDDVDGIVFDRVHRLGRRSGDGIRHPRPIVAKFEKYRDREKIRKTGIEPNKQKCGFTIREQFPIEMETKRKTLYPIMRNYQKNPNNKVTLVRDKLYVNGLVYNQEQGKLIEVNKTKQAQARQGSVAFEKNERQNAI